MKEIIQKGTGCCVGFIHDGNIRIDRNLWTDDVLIATIQDSVFTPEEVGMTPDENCFELYKVIPTFDDSGEIVKYIKEYIKKD